MDEIIKNIKDDGFNSDKIGSEEIIDTSEKDLNLNNKVNNEQILENKKNSQKDEASVEDNTDKVTESNFTDKETIIILKKEIEENKDKALRALAESENTRRQSEKLRSDFTKYGIQPLARELLSVIDNIDRALKTINNENQKGDNKDKEKNEEAFKNGIELTYKELEGILEKFNIKKLNPIGESFDPNLHQAMYESPSDKYDNGKICEVIQDGYSFYDRLLRPAMVGISKNTDAEENQAEKNDIKNKEEVNEN